MTTSRTAPPSCSPKSTVNLHLRLALADADGNEFFGPGVVELLEGIDRTGSIQQAARAMNLSYVKALKILRRTETALGRPLLIRSKGGAARGSSRLTPFATAFLRRFAVLRRSVNTRACGAFASLERWLASPSPKATP